MSVELDEAKDYLRVIGTTHDAKILAMIDRATQEAEDYIGRELTDLSSSSSDGLSESIKMGILILIERQWSTPIDKREIMTQAAHAALDPAREGWGI